MELCKSLDGHGIVDLPMKPELIVHDDLQAPKGEQVTQATLGAILQKIQVIESREEHSDRESTYLICGHADIAAITPNREDQDEEAVERKVSDAGKEEWNFRRKPTVVLIRCEVGRDWATANTVGVADFAIT
jgi:hypothetical protein